MEIKFDIVDLLGQVAGLFSGPEGIRAIIGWGGSCKELEAPTNSELLISALFPYSYLGGSVCKTRIMLQFPLSPQSSHGKSIDRSMKDRSICPLSRYHMGARPVSPGPVSHYPTNHLLRNEARRDGSFPKRVRMESSLEVYPGSMEGEARE